MKSLKVVKNDLFDYPHRYIMQLEDGFKFSLDSILLAEYVKLRNEDSVLDMCTGNAPVPLILSAKADAYFVGYEIQEDIAKLAEESVKINGLEDKIKVINDDVKNIGNKYKAESFDIITCNPPYFKTDENGYKNDNDWLTIARHEVYINLDDIFTIAFKYLKNKGSLYMVHRANRLDDIINLATQNRMNVKELQFIQTKKDEAPSTVIVKCVKNSNNGIKIKRIVCVDKVTSYQRIFD